MMDLRRPAREPTSGARPALAVDLGGDGGDDRGGVHSGLLVAGFRVHRRSYG